MLFKLIPLVLSMCCEEINYCLFHAIFQVEFLLYNSKYIADGLSMKEHAAVYS